MLDFSGETIQLAGRNLNADRRPNVRLFDSILRHKAPWLVECDQAAAITAAEGATARVGKNLNEGAAVDFTRAVVFGIHFCIP